MLSLLHGSSNAPLSSSIVNGQAQGPCAFDIPSWRSLRQGPSAVLAIIDAAMREHQAPLMGVIHSSVACAPLTHLKQCPLYAPSNDRRASAAREAGIVRPRCWGPGSSSCHCEPRRRTRLHCRHQRPRPMGRRLWAAAIDNWTLVFLGFSARCPLLPDSVAGGTIRDIRVGAAFAMLNVVLQNGERWWGRLGVCRLTGSIMHPGGSGVLRDLRSQPFRGGGRSGDPAPMSRRRPTMAISAPRGETHRDLRHPLHHHPLDPVPRIPPRHRRFKWGWKQSDFRGPGPAHRRGRRW